MNNSYMVEVRAVGETSWVKNGIRLPDEEQAKKYGADLYSRCSHFDEYRVAPSSDQPTHTWSDLSYGLIPIEEVKEEAEEAEEVKKVPYFYQQIAKALGETIEEMYDDAEESDAGVSFTGGYDLQISPYMPSKFSLNRMTADTWTTLFSSNSALAIIQYIKNNVKKEA